MFEFIVRLYKYIQQNPAGVSSVPISEPSAQYLVNPPLAAWWRLMDGTSGRSVKVLRDQGILDWVEIWALTRPLQDIQLVVFDLFVCGELQYSFFHFVLQLYLVLAILVNQNGPSRDKIFFSILNCTVLLISVELVSEYLSKEFPLQGGLNLSAV